MVKTRTTTKKQTSAVLEPVVVSQPEPETATALEGVELLQKVTSLKHLGISEKAKVCGYVSTTKTGKERVNVLRFEKALFSALGLDRAQENAKPSQKADTSGRSPTFRATVHANGNILIGSTYTTALQAKPGDQFEIKFGKRGLKLERVGTKDSDSDLDSAE